MDRSKEANRESEEIRLNEPISLHPEYANAVSSGANGNNGGGGGGGGGSGGSYHGDAGANGGGVGDGSSAADYMIERPFKDQHHPLIRCIWNVDRFNPKVDEKLKELRVLLNKHDPSVLCDILHDITGQPIAQATPLLIACFEGDPDVIKLLIEAGADVNQTESEHHLTPLHVICDAEYHGQSLRVMLSFSLFFLLFKQFDLLISIQKKNLNICGLYFFYEDVYSIYIQNLELKFHITIIEISKFMKWSNIDNLPLFDI